jgi:acetyl-CoA carboxylase biotin carboxyl carrier protein
MADAVTGRLFEPQLTALAEPLDDGRVVVASPAVGYWRKTPALGALVLPGGALGELEILGAVHRLVAPEGARGIIAELAVPRRGRVPVGYGERLALLDPEAAGVVTTRAASAPEVEASETGLAFRASSSGRFYSRPAPSKAPFVEVGQQIERGHTVCLLEVMKTYSRLVYGGDGLPERARVVAIRPSDGDDLGEGDVILELEPA